MPQALRAMYTNTDPVLGAAVRPLRRGPAPVFLLFSL